MVPFSVIIHSKRFMTSAPLLCKHAILIFCFIHFSNIDSFAAKLEDLYISGFVSQGFLVSTENNYLLSSSKEGTAEFSEIAVNITAEPMDRLRVGVQFLAFDFGVEGNNNFTLDWAYGDYRWRDYLGIRAGKIKNPMGFYNQQRDVDMLRISIFQPQSVYSHWWRDFALAHEGISLYGNSCFGGTGEFDYEFFGGALNIPDPDNNYWTDAFSRGQQDVITDTTAYYFKRIMPLELRFPWVIGGAIFWDLPIEGLRLGASYMTGEYEFESDFIGLVDDDLSNPEGYYLDIPIYDQDIYKMAVFSVEYLWHTYTFAGEFFLWDNSDNTPFGYYGQLTKQVNKNLFITSYYSESYNDLNDLSGKDLAEEYDIPIYYSWQKDLCISGRYDISNNWLIKLEGHLINGVNQTYLFQNPDGLKENWMYFAAKTTFHF